MLHDSCSAVVTRLRGYERAVEVGVGRRPEVAAGLAEHGVDVVVTDIHRREAPPGVTFAREDVTDPYPARYERAGVVYALNCPPELQRPLRDAARLGNADCFFTTLGTDPAVVRSDPETLGGTTLFRVRIGGPGTGRSTGSGDGTRDPTSGGGPA